MGCCWCISEVLEEEGHQRSTSEVLIQSSNTFQQKKCVFSKEEAKLDALLRSIRTGLVISETKFGCLPASISTTAKTTFRISSNRMNVNMTRSREDLQASSMEDSNEGEEEKQQDDEDSDREKEQSSQKTKDRLVVSLKGHGWVKGLTLSLDILPVFGPFAGKELHFHWSNDILEITGCSKSQLDTKILPISFETEAEFCKCGLLLAYSENKSSYAADAFADNAAASLVDNCELTNVAPLSFTAYTVAVANLDAVITCGQIPAQLAHKLFGSNDPVDLSLAVWPKTASAKNTSAMKVKCGILFAELNWLIKQHLSLKPQQTLKVYSSFKTVNLEDTVTERYKHLDCFVVPLDENGVCILGSCGSLAEEMPTSTHTSTVMSLVGSHIKEVTVDMQATMKNLDMIVRREFKLGTDSFLIILSEDDLMPQYMADDNWKCTYSFSIPNNSVGGKLRKSLHRLSTRRREVTRTDPSLAGTDNSLILPHMSEVIRLLSSSSRQFPQNASKRELSIEELYSSWSLYQRTAEQCGIHGFSMVKVFEVTGPSIPITIRVLFDHDAKEYPSAAPLQVRQSSRTQLANIIDINPEWSISTFLQYIDAVISLSSSLHQRRLWLRDNMVDSRENNLDKLKLGKVLHAWKPAWWSASAKSKGHLLVKDIDPAEYLVVEKF